MKKLFLTAIMLPLTIFAKIPNSKTAYLKTQSAVVLNLKNTKTEYVEQIEKSIKEGIDKGQYCVHVKYLYNKEALLDIIEELKKDGYDCKYYQNSDLEPILEVSWDKGDKK